MPSLSKVDPTPRWDCSTRRMISSFSDAGYTLRRVVLLTANRSVLLQNTVDDIREGGQFRAFRWLASPISRRFRMPQYLPHRLARNAKPTCRLSLAQTINMAGQPNAQI